MLLNLLLKLFSSNKEPKVEIFKASDYDLNYDHVLCEKCNQEIDGRDHYCAYESERIRKPKLFNTLDYDLNKNERKAKYEDYDYVICEKCNQEIDMKYYRCAYCYHKEIDMNERNRMKYGLKFEIFKTSDYDLGKDERKVKYKDYDHVLCEGCNQKIGWRYYCTDCYDKETDINERNHMKYGSKAKILELSDYDLNLEERNLKYIDCTHVLCEKCNQEISKLNYYCINCFSKEND